MGRMTVVLSTSCPYSRTMKAIQPFDNLVGLSVKAGSPGYEQLEVIQEVKSSDAYGSERLFVLFASGFHTNMTETDLELLMVEGEVEYTRYFANETDRACETMSLI